MGWFTADGTLGLVFEYFIKTTAVLTLALLTAAAARRRPAAFRHFVLSSALIGLLLLPVLSLFPIGWRTVLLPARPAEASTPEPVMRVPYSPPTAVAFPEKTAVSSRTAPAETVTERLPATVDILFREPSFPLPSYPRPDASPSAPLMVRAEDPGRSLLDIGLVVIWSAGLFILVLRLAVGLATASKLTAEGADLSGHLWRIVLMRFLALVPLRRKVRLKSHPEVFVPLTWGWRKPVILMPGGSDLWTEEERSSALFHELSHVKRADFLVMLAVRASLAVFWWNPLCWVACRELRKEQEIACDELVLRAGIKPSAYAASLLAFRRSAGFRWNPSSALLGMLGRASFSERLAVILKQKLTFKEVKMRTRIMLAVAVALAVVFVGTARPAVGIEKKTTAFSVFEAATPAAEAINSALPAADGQEKQADKAVAADQEEEKSKAAQKAEEAEKAEKEKAVVEKKIVIRTKEGAEVPIEVVITEGDVARTLVLDKPLTITLNRDGKALVLTSGGKELQVLKGDPLCLEIKRGPLKVLKEGKVLRIGEHGVWTIIKEGDKKGAKTAFQIRPEVKIECEGKTIKVITPDEAAKGEVAVGLAKAREAESGNKELLDMVRHIREQAEAVKAKKMDISVLEESLKELEAELQAKGEMAKKLAIKLDKVGVKLAVAKSIGPAVAKVIAKDDSTIQIIYLDKGTSSQDYERVVTRLKKDLPEGYKLVDSEFDTESGTMCFKIAPPEGAKTEENLIHKLIESLKEELKKAK